MTLATSRPRPLLLAFLLLPLLVLVAGACGGDDDSAVSTGTPRTPALATLPPAASPGPGVTDGEIRLGMTNDLKAVGGTPYAAVTTAVQAFLAKANQEDGGVCGRRIVLIAEDDQYTPELALQKTRKLVEEDGVLAVIGALGTPLHALVAPYLNDPNGDGNTDDGIPDLFLSTGWSGWGDVGKFPWSIGFIPDYRSDAQIIGRYINSGFKDKKVGILYQNDDFGKDYLDGLKGVLASAALLVSEQPYEAAATDVAEQVKSIRDAGAEVVVLASTPEFTAKAFAIAKAEGYKPQFLLSYVNSPSILARDIGGGTSPDQLIAGFAALAGTIVTDYLLSPVENAEDPAIIEHRRIMQTFDGPTVSSLSVYGQSLGETAVKALSGACATLTRRGLLQAAESIRGFRTTLLAPGIEIDLGADDHHAIQAMQPLEIQADGNLKRLGDPIATQ